MGLYNASTICRVSELSGLLQWFIIQFQSISRWTTAPINRHPPSGALPSSLREDQIVDNQILAVGGIQNNR